MKKLIALLTVFGFLTIGIANTAFAQNQKKTDEAATEQVAEAPEDTIVVDKFNTFCQETVLVVRVLENTPFVINIPDDMAVFKNANVYVGNAVRC